MTKYNIIEFTKRTNKKTKEGYVAKVEVVTSGFLGKDKTTTKTYFSTGPVIRWINIDQNEEISDDLVDLLNYYVMLYIASEFLTPEEAQSLKKHKGLYSQE